ncbi:hypothetical protein RIF29_41279 [Crotalaria pallida]|uniref:Uncharacterized protein n=1 Tax=Crotalaria pallida TaxID=3830 RepID=A0AAN9E5E2_CROPI
MFHAQPPYFCSYLTPFFLRLCHPSYSSPPPPVHDISQIATCTHRELGRDAISVEASTAEGAALLYADAAFG